MKTSDQQLNIEITKVIPTSVAQRCPNCRGIGLVNWKTETCISCGGKGYVLIPAIEQEEVRE